LFRSHALHFQATATPTVHGAARRAKASHEQTAPRLTRWKVQYERVLALTAAQNRLLVSS
jgi:hypothetical protein